MNKKTERKQNLRLIIEALRRQGSLSQARLKEICGLQASTVSYLINDLKNVELVKYTGKNEMVAKVGKPASTICLNNDKAAFLGMYVEDNRLHSYLIGIDGQTLDSNCEVFSTVNAEAALFQEIERGLHAHENIQGVGVTIKAIVYNDGTVKSGTRREASVEQKKWNFIGLLDSLKNAFPNLPIIVENDANCAAQLYQYENKATNGNFVVYLFNKEPFGIGCGLMIDGKVYRGAQGAAGEFFEKNLDIKQIMSQIGNEPDIVDKFLPAMTPHIFETAYLLNPERIVIAGNLVEDLSQTSLEKTHKLFEKLPMPTLFATGDAALNPARGAALLAINDYIERFLEEVEKR